MISFNKKLCTVCIQRFDGIKPCCLIISCSIFAVAEFVYVSANVFL
ncbi:Uncharacterised protein [Vibrio cholerae]|uniref:Uncharacterized protein n=1 Tax=Vibrio cholerae TaxID=666 RepID=A0A655S4D7_VIBCL|nr:Uncharacterised protein [Vibrio cholerae]